MKPRRGKHLRVVRTGARGRKRVAGRRADGTARKEIPGARERSDSRTARSSTTRQKPPAVTVERADHFRNKVFDSATPNDL